MSYRIATVAAPGEPVVTVDDLKSHSHIDASFDDSNIRGYIAAATDWAERFTRRAFVEQTFVLYLQRFPVEPFVLPRSPFKSITSITYLDASFQEQTVSPTIYRADPAGDFARVYLAPNQSWPTIPYAVDDAVRITFVAGYGKSSDVPEGIKQAVRLLAADWAENRENSIVNASVTPLRMGAERLLWAFRAGL